MFPPRASSGGKQLFRVGSTWKTVVPRGVNCGPPGNAFLLAARTFTVLDIPLHVILVEPQVRRDFPDI